MSILRRVIEYMTADTMCGSGIDDEYFTDNGHQSPNITMTGTSDTGIQVGIPSSKTLLQQKHNQRTSTRASAFSTVAATIASAAEQEEYRTGKVISKLFKPEKKKQVVDEAHTCCVCLESICIGNTNMTRTGCGHVFHLTCLLKSLEVKNTCPMCRMSLEETRQSRQVPNVLTPVSAEQIITEEISYFPNAAHAQSIVLSRHPKRRLKELLRVFGFTLLRTVAEYIHEDNMPIGWYDDGETTDESEDDDSDNNDNSYEGNEDNEDNNSEGSDESDEEDNDEENDNQEIVYDTNTSDGV